MTARYQLLYYVPDALLGERLLMGAVVRDSDAAPRVIPSGPASLERLGDGGRVRHLRALLATLASADSAQHLPSVLGPDVELGKERPIPAEVADPAHWLAGILARREPLVDWIVNAGFTRGLSDIACPSSVSLTVAVGNHLVNAASASYAMPSVHHGWLAETVAATRLPEAA